MIGWSLILTIASITSRVNNFGTALTPMMAVGRTASTASRKVAIGARSCAKRLLEVRKIGARAHNQTIDVEQHVAMPRRLQVHALTRHRRGPGAEKQEPLAGEFLPRDPQGTGKAGQRGAGRTLDVVVEGADLVLVACQDRDGVEVREILPLDAAFRPEILHGRDELIDEGLVVVAARTVLAQSEIERVLQQGLIVRADVEHDR